MTSGPIRRESIQFWGSLVSDSRPTRLGIHDCEQAHNHVVPLAARRSCSKRTDRDDLAVTRIRGFAPRLFRRFALVLGARLTGVSCLTLASQFTPAADRTPIRSLLLETYDRIRNSQKTLVDEALTMPRVGRLSGL